MEPRYSEFINDITKDVKDIKTKPDLQLAVASHLQYYFNTCKKEKLTYKKAMNIVKEWWRA